MPTADHNQADTQLLDSILFAHDADQLLVASEHDDATAYESTASLVTAALIAPSEPPRHLCDRLRMSGQAFCAGFESAADQLTRPRAPRPWLASMVVGAVLGAAAAGLLLNFDAGGPPSLYDLRQEALQRDPMAVHANWQNSDVEGDVVWRPQEQTGWLTFRGLPQLGPDQAYQLWIVDASRPEPHPVDGGLFRPDTGEQKAGETIVPIRARLPIGKAAGFVVTVEKAPGVVVSEQKRVLAKAIF